MKISTFNFCACALIALAFMATGCHNGAGPDVIPVTQTKAKMYFHLHTNIDTNEVDDYGNIYTTSAGRKISLTKAQIYISGIELIKADGSTYSVPDTIVLKQLDPEEYFVAYVPSGTYKSVKFNVGLDAATNAMNSTAYTELNHSDMWFGSSAQPDGYVFVNMQGTIDTTTAATGTTAQMQPFMYMIGTNAHLKQIIMPDHNPVYTFADSQATFVHIIVDYSKLFNGVQLNNSANLMIMSAADNTSAISNTVTGNIPSMFSYEE